MDRQTSFHGKAMSKPRALLTRPVEAEQHFNRFATVVAGVSCLDGCNDERVLAPDRSTFLQQSWYPAEVLPAAWGGTIDSAQTPVAMKDMLRQRYDQAASFCLTGDDDDASVGS